MTEPDLKVGQIWRRVSNGRTIRIFALRKWQHSQTDVHWRGHDYKGSGAVWESSFRANYEFVQEAADE